MKKVLLTLTVAAGLAMTSCGGMDVCGCFESELKYSKDMEAANGDEAKIKEIKAAHEADKTACDAVEKEFKESIKDLDHAAQEAKMKELMDDCPAMKEMMGGE